MAFKDWFKPLASTSSKSLQQHMQAADILKQQYAAQTAAARGKAAQGLQGYASPHQPVVNTSLSNYAAQQIATQQAHINSTYQNASNQQLSNQYPFTPGQVISVGANVGHVVYSTTTAHNMTLTTGGGGVFFGQTSPYFTPKFDPAWLAEYHEAHEEAVLRRVVEET